jgi:hypothetical protein
VTDFIIYTPRQKLLGFEVLSVLVMKNSIFWDITPYSPSKVNVSEEHVTYIFGVEEKAKQEITMKQAASKIY